MARHYERRAALAAAAATPGDDTGETPMKIQFTSVYLDREIPRFVGGTKGLAASSTTFFDVAKAGLTIELDTATQLVRLSKGDAVMYVPLSKVDRFGPTVEDARAVVTPITTASRTA